MTDADSWPEDMALASIVSWMAVSYQYSDDQQLYHYTDITGLEGILDKGQIWLTHMAYLNDSKEFEYGLGVVCDMIKDLADWLKENPDKTTSPESVEFVCGLYRTVADGIASGATSFKYAHAPFVACLSRSRDQLSQWRGYANGGYAIAFDPELLRDSLTIVGEDGDQIIGLERPRLTEVIYLKNEVYERVKGLIEARVKNTAEAIMAKDDAKKEEVDREFTDSLIEIASLLKHVLFFEENERRIVSRCRETFFTSSVLGLRPRARASYNKRAVKEVIVGPSAYGELRKASLERYFEGRKDDFGDVEVRQSKIPYREI